MNKIKFLVVSFLILFLFITLIGLLFPSEVRVSRVVETTAPFEKVKTYVFNIKYWKLWMETAQTHNIKFYTLQTEGEGTIAEIDKSRITIARQLPNELVTEWETASGNKFTAIFHLQYQPNKNTTIVSWMFIQHVDWYPWERIASLMSQKILSPPMEKSLSTLKQVVEQ